MHYCILHHFKYFSAKVYHIHQLTKSFNVPGYWSKEMESALKNKKIELIQGTIFQFAFLLSNSSNSELLLMYSGMISFMIFTISFSLVVVLVVCCNFSIHKDTCS